MAYGRVYKITCVVSGKTYVGQTTRSLRRRWTEHVYDATRGVQVHFYNAIRKYGAESFEVTQLEECPDRETLDDREVFWIRHLNTLEEGYNCKEGGDSHVWSAEARKRQSERQIGKPGKKHTEEAKRRISEAHRGERNYWWGKIPSVATNEKRSASLRARSHHMRGKKHTPEMIEKFKASHAGRVVSEETKRKVSQTMSGRVLSQEHKDHLRGKKQEVACPNCGKVGAGPTMQRWHFDKCRNKHE